MNIRKQLIALLALIVTSAAAIAQIAPPTMPSPVRRTAGNSGPFYIRNVTTGTYLCDGNAYGTQLSVGLNDTPRMGISIIDVEAGVTVSYLCHGSNHELSAVMAGQVLQVASDIYTSEGQSLLQGLIFRDTHDNAFVDLDYQGHGYLWQVQQWDGDNYIIWSLDRTVDDYDMIARVGIHGMPVSFDYMKAEPTDDDLEGALWQLYDVASLEQYAALTRLYNLIKSVEGSYDVSQATAYYNEGYSHTTAEILAYIDTIEPDIRAVLLHNLAAQATIDNPADITDLAILNADFSNGTRGWTLPENPASVYYNIQYNGATHTNADVTVSGFVEAWRNELFGALEDIDIYQQLLELPAGSYRLGVDAIASHADLSAEEIQGVELFATTASGEGTTYTVSLQCDPGVPQHFDLRFILDTPEVITIGIRARSTNANWIAADNFQLITFGADASEVAMLQAELASAVAAAQSLEGQIPAGAYARLASVIVLNNRTYTSVAAYQQAIDNVRSAHATAAAFVEPYQQLLAVAAEIENEEDDGSQAYQELQSTRVGTLQAIEDNADIIATDVEAAAQSLKSALAAYQIQKGHDAVDITDAYIVNPQPVGDYSGWEFPYVEPNMSNQNAQLAEFWRQQGAVIQQTLHNLPAGDYTLTAIAYTRVDINATLFAGDARISVAQVSPSEVNTLDEGNSWLAQGNGINSLNFTMPTDGDITIGLQAGQENDGWLAWRRFYLYTGHIGRDSEIGAEGDTITVANETGTFSMVITGTTTAELVKADNLSPEVIIPSSAGVYTVTSIGTGVFINNTTITSVTLPEALISIGRNAFRACSKLSDISLPETLEQIDTYAFTNCTGLTTLTLPAALTSIGNYAFYGCNNLRSIEVLATTPPTIADNTFALTVRQNATLTVPFGTLDAYKAATGWSSFSNISAGTTDHNVGDIITVGVNSATMQFRILTVGDAPTCAFIGIDNSDDEIRFSTLTIPSEVEGFRVTAIATQACRNWSHLSELSLPSTVTDIETYAFMNCTNLQQINFSEGLTTIGTYAFRGCTSLTSLELPATVTKLDAYSFYGCSALESIVLPAALQSIGTYAFYNCSALANITINALTPPTLSSSPFLSATYTKATLTVPAGTLAAYQAANLWSRFTNIVDPGIATVQVIVEGHGTVTIAGYQITSSGAVSIDLSARQTIVVTPDGGNSLASIILNDGEQDIDLTSTVNATTGQLSYKFTSAATIRVTFTQIQHLLTISRTGDGEVTLNDEPVVFDATLGGRIAVVDKSGVASLLLGLKPAPGEVIAQVNVGGKDITSSFDDATSVDITDLAVGTVTIIIDFGSTANSFSQDGIYYVLPDVTLQEVKVGKGTYTGDLVIPSTVTHNDKDYKVIGIADSAFQNSNTLRSVTVPNGVRQDCIGKDLFEGCSNLAAIVWCSNTVDLPVASFGSFVNLNLLVYTTYYSRVKAIHEAKLIRNVLTSKTGDDYQAEVEIKLDDYLNQSNFYAPHPFHTRRIEYKHQFTMSTSMGTCQGWETIALPFTVQSYLNLPKLATLTPFALLDDIERQRPFWLYAFGTDGQFHEAETIEAYQPYIISMPNDAIYPETYNVSGEVTFRADDVDVPATPASLGVTGGSLTFTPNFSLASGDAQRYILNVDNALITYQGAGDKGSTFVRQNQTSLPSLPFTAYFTTSVAGAKDSFGIFDTLTDAVRALPVASELKAEGIYDLSGRRVDIPAARLPRGVYIIDGRKVAVR